MAFLFLLFVTILSFVINGYYYNYIDSNIYLVYIKKLSDPLLYKGDYLFSQAQTNYTLINSIFVFLNNLLGFDYSWLYLLFFITTTFLIYYSLFYLTKEFTKNRIAPYLAVLFFMVPKWVASIGNFTHARFFISRDLSFSICLLTILFIIKKRFFLAGVLTLIALLINPSIVPPIIILLFFSVYSQIKLKHKNYFLFFTLIFLIIAPLIYILKNINGNLFDNEWLNIMKLRGPYSFPHLWRYTGWGNLLLYFILAIPPLIYAKIKNKRVLIPFLLICFGLFVFHIIISLIFPVAFLIQFQLLRSLTYISVFFLILVSVSISDFLGSKKIFFVLPALAAATIIFFWGDHLTYYHIGLLSLFSIFSMIYLPSLNPKNNYKDITINTFIFLLILFYVAYSLVIKKPKIYLPFYFATPTYYTSFDEASYWDWINLQIWVKNNTPINTVFLTPPNLEGFRIFSERSTIGESKDGAVIFYSPTYAKEWKKRNDLLTGKYTCKIKDLKDLKQIYNFDYIVLQKQKCQLNLEKVYQNNTFEIIKF